LAAQTEVNQEKKKNKQQQLEEFAKKQAKQLVKDFSHRIVSLLIAIIPPIDH
jgi:hypothetical protein